MTGDVKGADLPDLSGFFADNETDQGEGDEWREQVPPQPPVPPVPPVETKAEETPAPEEPVREEPADEAPAAPPVPSKTVNVVAYVQDKHRTKLKALCARTGKTYVDVLFEAVDELDDELPQIFAGALAAQARESRFARRRQPSKVSADPKAGGEVQVPFRMLLEDRAVLDELATQYTGGNRTELIRVVLRTYLNRP